MFTFLHRILLFGYNGKSGGSNRGRSQKAHNAHNQPSKQSHNLVYTNYLKSVPPRVLPSPKVAKVRNIEHVKDLRLNKNPVALVTEEAQPLKMLQQLLKVDLSMEGKQLDICKLPDEHCDDSSNRTYLYLGEIQDTNEKLYITLLSQYIDQYLPIVKTPAVCTYKDFGLIYKKPKSVLINIYDKGRVYELLKQCKPEHDIRAVIVTECGRILGSENPADRSPFGRGIPMSKLALYTALAGIKPDHCLPITLDVGTDNLTLIDDPAYTGLKQKRVKGEEYDEFIDEFMDACVERFGPNTLVLKTAP